MVNLGVICRDIIQNLVQNFIVLFRFTFFICTSLQSVLSNYALYITTKSVTRNMPQLSHRRKYIWRAQQDKKHYASNRVRASRGIITMSFR